MCRVLFGLTLSGTVLAWGCGGDQQPAELPASRPASAPAAKAAAEAGPRTYEPIPESLFASAPSAEPSARAVWALFQFALADDLRDEAIRVYERLKQEFPNERPLRAAVGVQLADALLNTSPPNLDQAEAVLNDLAAVVRDEAVGPVLRDGYESERLLLLVAQGRRALEGDDKAFTEWFDALLRQSCRHEGPGVSTPALLHAMDHLMSDTGPKQPAVVDRLESVVEALQRELAWASPETLRALHERRVQLLFDAGRSARGLFEARTLLALSSQDAKAWTATIDRMSGWMAAAGHDAADSDRFRLFQEHGLAGPDGRAGTADDLADPLADLKRDAGGPNEGRGRAAEPQMPDSVPASSLARSVQAGAALLLAGRGAEAVDHFARLVSSVEEGPDPLKAVALEYLAMTHALADGHALSCQRGAMDLAVGAGGAKTILPIWRDEAHQFLNRREAFMAAVASLGRQDLVLGLCRTVADDDRDAAGSQAAIELAWRTCRAAAKGTPLQNALRRFRQFGGTLTRPQARIDRVRLVAERYKELGEESEVLAEIETLSDIRDEAMRDPALALLHASCLVRLDRADEALPEVRALCERCDPAPEWRYRAQLLLGVIYVQAGEPAMARDVLRRLLDEKPPRECSRPAKAILGKIQM